jgi:hypothetical protein
MRVLFIREFRWRIPERAGRVAIVFRPRPEAVIVRRVCGEAAVRAGVAEEARSAAFGATGTGEEVADAGRKAQ